MAKIKLKLQRLSKGRIRLNFGVNYHRIYKVNNQYVATCAGSKNYDANKGIIVIANNIQEVNYYAEYLNNL